MTAQDRLLPSPVRKACHSDGRRGKVGTPAEYHVPCAETRTKSTRRSPPILHRLSERIARSKNTGQHTFLSAEEIFSDHNKETRTLSHASSIVAVDNNKPLFLETRRSVAYVRTGAKYSGLNTSDSIEAFGMDARYANCKEVVCLELEGLSESREWRLWSR